MRFLKQSTSVVVPFGPFVDVTDGATLEIAIAAATLDHVSTGIMISKNGGTLAVRNGTPTASAYDAHGIYKITLNATDTNGLGTLRMIFTDPATHLAVWDDFMVMPANVYDTMFGTDEFDVNVVQWLGTTAATPTTAGVPEVDVTFIGGTAAPETAGVLNVNATQIEGSDATDQINAAVDVALNTAIPGTPTADSINQRLVAIDDLTQASGAGDLAAILVDTGTDGVVLATDAVSAAALATDAVAELTAAIKAIIVEDDGATGDTSITLGDGLAYLIAIAAGVATGQGTASGVFKSPGGNENRVTGTTDTDANRSGIVLTPPS